MGVAGCNGCPAAEINDNWMHIRPNSFNNVTNRSNGQESFHSRTQVSVEKISFFFFWKEIHMIIFWKNCSKYVPLPQKKFKKDKVFFLKKILEVDLCEDFFGWKDKKNENIKGPLKNRQEFVFQNKKMKKFKRRSNKFFFSRRIFWKRDIYENIFQQENARSTW